MSRESISIESFRGTIAPSATLEEWAVYSSSRASVTEGYQVVPSFAPASRRKRPPTTTTAPRVLRRMKGFLIENLGRECKVGFVENNKVILYYLPADRLQQAGIIAENQPFELDEFECKNEDGSFSSGYTFRQLASPNDAYSEPLTLDEDRQRKRTLIFQRFGKTKA